MTLSPDSSRTKISNGRNSLILKSENEFYAMSVAYDLTFDVFSYFEGLSSINEDATESIQDLTTRMYVPHFSSSAVTDGKFVLSTGFVPVLTR